MKKYLIIVGVVCFLFGGVGPASADVTYEVVGTILDGPGAGAMGWSTEIGNVVTFATMVLPDASVAAGSFDTTVDPASVVSLVQYNATGIAWTYDFVGTADYLFGTLADPSTVQTAEFAPYVAPVPLVYDWGTGAGDGTLTLTGLGGFMSDVSWEEAAPIPIPASVLLLGTGLIPLLLISSPSESPDKTIAVRACQAIDATARNMIAAANFKAIGSLSRILA